ncbi:hypothetical protein P152DRAFT_467423 [Eremomyces bilateralis CBS 781.70]|uniref:Uncharacterized protein n=1 Tax=Eremomyces bilateralis CBS 781.70 TaxID=1392243 RepID=A0A6G1FZ38_9PEZI|nr:uncharacterized protein P152DRAFT_467423 [Eremomyces bilateralis CBS 781.70]KAF1811054.1 hypothetical protein P152DRAFT_467423 [Eremomyces bilateralis CBS 781.70]
MPTNRPFFSHFFAAFRAQSAYQTAKPTTGTNTSTSTSATAQSTYATHTASTTNSHSEPTPPTNPHHRKSPTNLPTSPSSPHGATTVAVQAAASGPAFPPSRHSPSARSPPPPFSYPLNSSRQRRGSDSSSEGFKEVAGAEKWYVGGRTAGGDERFYKLSMVKRPRSLDRMSLDRMSL